MGWILFVLVLGFSAVCYVVIVEARATRAMLVDLYNSSARVRHDALLSQLEALTDVSSKMQSELHALAAESVPWLRTLEDVRRGYLYQRDCDVGGDVVTKFYTDLDAAAKR